MTAFHMLSALVTAAALASYVNHRFLRLPPTVGLMAISLAVSVALGVLGFAGVLDIDGLSSALEGIDFSDLLLHGMLAFLLFAGALHVDVSELRREAAAILTLATASVAVTCVVTATLVWGAAALLGVELPYVYALVFGALIAPTDPIAVLAIMREARAPQSIEIRITGESLFNDGVGVVLFLMMLHLAQGSAPLSVGEIATLFAKEVAGGLAIGAGLGWLTYLLIRPVNQYAVEVMLTVALAAGSYSVAEVMNVSAPIAAVVAGLVIGNHGRAHAMSSTTRRNVDTFWELIDELLNAVLFVLIGLEVLVLEIHAENWRTAALAAAAIPATLLARVAAVALPAPLFGMRAFGSRVAILTWAGLRGGISIALALSLPQSPARNALLLCAYVVVVFSVLVQGLTLKRLLTRLCPRVAPPAPPSAG